MECTPAMEFYLIMNRLEEGETFVTRKITRGISNISQGLENCLYMGNLDSLRDWGHAKRLCENAMVNVTTRKTAGLCNCYW